MSKRKAADANLDGGGVSIDQLFGGGGNNGAGRTTATATASHRDVANALLALLPANATKQHDEAKKLLRAFPLVAAELGRRANELVRDNEAPGKQRAMDFYCLGSSNNGEKRQHVKLISLPLDVSINLLQFLPRNEITRLSFVSKAWLSASRNPLLWTTLDPERHSTSRYYRGLSNMTDLLKLLSRPQFSRLKALKLPSTVHKLGKTGVKQIAKFCPCLEEIDFGRYSKAKDNDLAQTAELLPNLSKIRLGLDRVTSQGISTMIGILGERLLEIRMHRSGFRHYLSDATVTEIAKSCPNLQCFSYVNNTYQYNIARDSLTERGIIALVRNCPKLEILYLCGTANVGLPALETIVELGDKLNLRLLCLTNQNKAPPTFLSTAAGERVRRQLESCIDEVKFNCLVPLP